MEPEIFKAYQHRLYLLRLEVARKGFNTPPEVLIEIDDIQQKLKGVVGHQGPVNLPQDATGFATNVDFVSGIIRVLRKLQDKTASLVPCLIDAMLISAKTRDQPIESYCYCELIGWQNVDFNMLPRYRIVPGYYTEPAVGAKQVYQFLTDEQQMKECDILAKESVIEIYSIISEHRIKARMVNELSTDKDRWLQRLSSDKPILISKSIDDIMNKPKSSTSIEAYMYSLYDEILEAVRVDLFNRLIGLLIPN